MKEIWLIEELWQDPLENRISDAIGYTPIGFVTTKEDTEKYSSYTIPANRWPILQDTPKYRITKIMHMILINHKVD